MSDEQIKQWPVSNVTLAHPVGMPSDVALLGLCDMPAGVPLEGPGLALSMVVFQIVKAANGEKLGEEVGLPDNGKVQCVFGTKDLTALWKALTPGASFDVRVVAWPRFYNLKEDGSADLDGDDRGYHAGAKVRSVLCTLALGGGGELLINGQAMPKPTDPGPTPEEQAAIDASDRQMAKERAERERREKALRDRVARENAENDARIEREEREAAEQAKRDAAQAEADREHQNAEMDAEHRRAAAERKRLGIDP